MRDYIEKSRAGNMSDEQIKRNLLDNGWSEQIVTEALGGKVNPVPVAPQIPTPSVLMNSQHVTQKSNMWDAFEHILLFISLYVLATSIALILHYFVDKWFPAAVTSSSSYYYSASSDSWQLTLLRGYVASLIVSFPLFIFFFLQIMRRTIKNPEIRNLKSRKFLIYATLVGTFIIMLGNVITIVFNLLNGNVSFNFILHFCITIGISAIIFIYYTLQIKEDRLIYG